MLPRLVGGEVRAQAAGERDPVAHAASQLLGPRRGWLAGWAGRAPPSVPRSHHGTAGNGTQLFLISSRAASTREPGRAHHTNVRPHAPGPVEVVRGPQYSCSLVRVFFFCSKAARDRVTSEPFDPKPTVDGSLVFFFFLFSDDSESAVGHH